MTKLLYITANTKSEELSSSKTVARTLLNSILLKYPDLEVEEVDLYKEHIPQLKYYYYEKRNKLITEEERKKLTEKEQKEINTIIKLCNQFINADIYILAAPMWSLSFPAPVKEYIDCIVQSEKTICFDENKPQGLLNDKIRTFIYVQSSGAHIPWIVKPALNKGLNYVNEIMKFIGIDTVKELLVDGTGVTEIERQEAITKANSKIENLIKSI